MTTLRLPWPDSRLSGNGRKDRRYLTKERRAAREVGFWTVQEAELCLPAVPLQMTLKLCPPDKRRRDIDNVLSAFKPSQDGIFAALSLDDSLVTRLVIERGAVEPQGAVYVNIEPMEAE